MAKKFEWASVMHDNPSIALNNLITAIKTLINTATTTNKKSKSKKLPRKPWITTGISISCQTKESLYLIYKRSNENLSLKTEYKNYTKILDKVIKFAKRNYESSIVKKKTKNTKDLWAFINSKLKKKTYKI